MSSRVGSVFLGDIQRHRHLASSNHSTPPSSPPPTAGSGGSISGVFSLHNTNTHTSPPHMSSLGDIDVDVDPADLADAMKSQLQLGDIKEESGLRGPGKVDPLLALELRLRWLEALILGVKQDLGKDWKGKGRESRAYPNHNDTLVRLSETVQQKLDKAVEGNEGLKRFMDNYDQHAHLLTPSFALSGILPDPPTYDKMTPQEINAFLAEMEPDIRAADRDMLEIDALEKKGVLGAGKLPEYEHLETRLETLLKAHLEDVELAASLETRVSTLVDRHTTYVDTLSELFVAWDDTITEAEDKLARMEREKAERLRLGLE